LIDVGTGKIEQSVIVDCLKCTIDDIFTKTLHAAVLQLAEKKEPDNFIVETKKNDIKPKSNFVPDDMVLIDDGIRSFYIDKYEVSQEQFLSTMGRKRFNTKNCPKCPADNVTWPEAKKYCEYLGKRLPTEIEWEVAAGQPSKWNRIDIANRLKFGWFQQNSSNNTHPVGLKLPNEYGLYDMLGNVWEYVSDLGSTTDHNMYGGSEEVQIVRRKGGSYEIGLIKSISEGMRLTI